MPGARAAKRRRRGADADADGAGAAAADSPDANADAAPTPSADAAPSTAAAAVAAGTTAAAIAASTAAAAVAASTAAAAAAAGTPGPTPTPKKKARPPAAATSFGPTKEAALRAKAARIVAQLTHLYPPPLPIPLSHGSPFQLLVAVMLSAQSTDAKVNTVTPALFAAAPDAAAMAAMQVADIEAAIRVLGLAPTKARNLQRMSQLLLELHDGQVPASFEALEALPGVGHKTASVVMAQAFGKPAFPVDTHIHRLAQRWGLSNGKNVEQTEHDLKTLLPEAAWGDAHLQLIFFGRQHCPAQRHDAGSCPICSWAAPGGGRAPGPKAAAAQAAAAAEAVAEAATAAEEEGEAAAEVADGREPAAAAAAAAAAAQQQRAAGKGGARRRAAAPAAPAGQAGGRGGGPAAATKPSGPASANAFEAFRAGPPLPAGGVAASRPRRSAAGRGAAGAS